MYLLVVMDRSGSSKMGCRRLSTKCCGRTSNPHINLFMCPPTLCYEVPKIGEPTNPVNTATIPGRSSGSISPSSTPYPTTMNLVFSKLNVNPKDLSTSIYILTAIPAASLVEANRTTSSANSSLCILTSHALLVDLLKSC